MKRFVSLVALAALITAVTVPPAVASPARHTVADTTLQGLPPGRDAQPRHLPKPAANGAAVAAGAAVDIPGRFVVGVKTPLPLDTTSVAGARVVSRGEGGHFAVVAEPTGIRTASVMRALAARPGVAYVEPLRRGWGVASTPMIPNDPLYRWQWWMHDIGAPYAWSVTTGSPSITIAVVDTGIDDFHPELAGHVVRGWNWVANDYDTMDDNGHGTHVAGIVGATADDGTSTAGVAPGCRIVAEKVLAADGQGTNAAIANGIYHAISAAGANIINMSLGSTSYDLTIDEAVAYAQSHGCIVVAAAGNNGSSQSFYPAQYPGVVAVSATSRGHGLAYFSNYGSASAGSHITLAAPGDEILSLAPGGGTATMSGTSMASPVVAGTMGLVWSRNPGWTSAQVVDQVESTAMSAFNTSLPDDQYGYGIVDPASAVGAAPYAADAFETDDTTADAKPMAAGAWEEHSFNAPYNQDVHSFAVQGGHRYILQTDYLMFTATRLGLLDASGTPVAANDERVNGALESQITWTAAATSTAFASVNDVDSAPDGRYGVRVLDKGPAMVPQSLAGVNRYTTAVQVSQASFPHGASTVVIATGQNYADALGGGALAGAYQAPIILVPSTGTVPSAVLGEIKRLGATRALILGGAGAVNAWVETQVKGSLAGAKEAPRYAGVDRYDTAARAAVAAWTKWKATHTDSRRAFVAVGTNFGDALLAGPLAYRTGAPVLLTQPGGLSPYAKNALIKMGVNTVTLIGGYDRMTMNTQYQIPQVAINIYLQCPLVYNGPGIWDCSLPTLPQTAVVVGNYATAVLGMHWSGVGFAAGAAPWDSMAAAPLLGNDGTFLMITNPSSLDPFIRDRVTVLAEDIDAVRFFGGTGALAQGVRDRVMDILQ